MRGGYGAPGGTTNIRPTAEEREDKQMIVLKFHIIHLVLHNRPTHQLSKVMSIVKTLSQMARTRGYHAVIWSELFSTLFYDEIITRFPRVIKTSSGKHEHKAQVP